MLPSILLLSVGLLALTGGSEGQRRQAVPQMVTQPQVLEGEVGGDVTLPCAIRNVGRKSVFWFKGKSADQRELLLQLKNVRGRFLVPRRYQGVLRTGKLGIRGTDLTIRDLTPDDADSYTCSVAWARQSVTHVVHVAEEEPEPELSVEYLPENLVAAVPKYGSVTLICNATGIPEPVVTWYRQGDEGQVLAEGSSLTFYEAQPEDTGFYVCVASNGGVLEDMSETFQLEVEYVEVEAVQTKVVVYSDERVAQLACKVDGYPEPQVVWYTTIGPVENDETHHYSNYDGVHYLDLDDVTASDLGDYQCYVYNQGARDLATMTLESIPGPVRVLTAEPLQSSTTYNITYEVESLTPIHFYYFSFMEVDTGAMTSSSVEGPESTTGNATHYVQSTYLPFTPGVTYQLLIRAVAEVDGPKMSEDFIFTAADPVEEEEYEEEEGETGEETQTEGDDWRMLKSALTIMSRLPKLAQALQ